MASHQEAAHQLGECPGSRVMLSVRSSRTVRTFRASTRASGAPTQWWIRAKSHVTTWEAPVEIDLVGSFEFVGVSVAGAPEQEDVAPAGMATLPSIVSLARNASCTGKVTRGGAPPQRTWRSARDSDEALLKFRTLGQHANRIAEQARRGLSPRSNRVVRMPMASESLNTPSFTACATAPRRSSLGSSNAADN